VLSGISNDKKFQFDALCFYFLWHESGIVQFHKSMTPKESALTVSEMDSDASWGATLNRRGLP